MPQDDINQPIQITLPLGAWNAIQLILAERPWKDVNVLILSIQQQLNTATEGGGAVCNVVPMDREKTH
jgi:hypothetical protein